MVFTSLFFMAANTGGPKYELSTYFNPEFAGEVSKYKDKIAHYKFQKGMDFIHNGMLKKLPVKITAYFNAHSNLKILDFAPGDIFGDKAKDYVFVVFDSGAMIAEIMIYNGKTNEYGALFGAINVIRGLNDDTCGYHFFGSLDYIIGSMVADNIGPITNDYKKFDMRFCKCADITKYRADNSSWNTFILDKGCYAEGFSKKNSGGFDAICISTDRTYNDWECLKYDKTLGAFIIFYGQAFAD